MTSEANTETGNVDGHQQSFIGLSPEIKAASMICGIKPYSSASEEAIIGELKRQIDAVAAGDMTRPAAMLAAHAETLDALFYSLVSQAQRADSPETRLVLLNAAIKVQEGCRSAVEGLALIKQYGCSPQ